MRHTLIGILISILFVISLSAKDNIKFHTLTPKGGLSYDGITDISQDKRGFIWIVLENNIYRFDGYTYKSYKDAFGNSVDGNIGQFNNISHGKDGDMYVSTTNGIYKFNIITETFELIIEASNNYVYIDNSNRVWIIHSGNVSYLDDNNQLISPEYSGRKLALHNKMIAESDDNVFLFSNFGHIYIYNEETKQMDDFTNINNLFDDHSLSKAQIRGGFLWMVVSNYTILKVDIATREVVNKYHYNKYANNGVRCAYVSSDNKVWIGSMNGLYVIDPDAETIKLHENKQDNKFTIPHSSVWTINEDNNNNIWIGTYAGAAAYVNHFEENIFETYHLSTNGLMKTPVSGFVADQDNVWISTEGGGVNVLNKKTQNFSYYTHQANKNSVSGNYTKPSAIDSKGNIWIPTFRAGLSRYNTKTNTFTTLKSVSQDSTSLLSNDLRKVILEPDSGLWIVYQQHSPKISFLSFDNLKVKHFSPDYIEGFQFSSSDYIYDLCRGNDDKIWFISSSLLFSMDIETKLFSKYDIPSSKRIDASTLCIDNEGIIWIGTFGNELISFDTSSKSFDNYPKLLPSDIVEIYSINWVDENIWLGANDGLYAFNKNTKKVSVFKESDGTQGDVYYRLATYKSEDNKLYFGGTGGFTIIDAHLISENPIKPITIISDFYLDYKPVNSHNDLNINVDMANAATIKLSHNQQNFGFKISSDNFLNSDKNKFKYRLKNYDKQWISTDAQNRIIHYSKIPPGTYFFEVQSANNDGVWGNTSSIKIIRKPAPWASLTAWIIYLIMFAALLYYFISSYRSKKRLENKLYLDQIEKEKREEIHKNQFLFFTNVSHDLKTPLALIMATINKMREEGMKEYYYKILNNNSQRLMLLLNDILDFRNLQKNKIKLAVSDRNLNEFVLKIANDFNELAREKKIDYEVSLQDNSLNNVPFDTEIMERIALNLFNNAFKYTDNGGKIKIVATTEEFASKYSSCYSIKQNENFDTQNSYKIIVSDTGVGITEESIAKVFDRFYKVDTKNENKHLGTGIGLALVKELIAVHKANITICSERDVGTDFIIQFSSDIDFYELDERKTTKESEDKNEATIEDLFSEVFLSSEDSDNQAYTSNDGDAGSANIDKNKTILIAEDNEDLRELLKSSLSQNYNIVDFGDAKPALDYLKSNDVVDMIVSDIMMPEVDGITFCKTIKSDVETSHIPFILLTAKSGVESQLEGTESGADLYLEKPTDLNLLRAAISNIFKQQEILKNHYASNYFADVSEIATNREDSKFLNNVTNIIESYLDKSELDVNTIATEMMMSRSKLYSKIKSLTGKSIVEFILNYRLRKAAQMLTEGNTTIQEAMYSVGIESRSYFTNSFKKEFGMPPSKFIEKNSKR